MARTIFLNEYDPDWPSLYAAEADALRAILGDRANRIEHVGSTSVPGLVAKPVIDIQVSVSELHPLQPYKVDLSALGYRHISLPPPPPPLKPADDVYPYFKKPLKQPDTHHVHLCISGSDQERDHLIFRDFLRTHSSVAREYVELKRRLAEAHLGDTLESRERYSLGKTEFVQTVLDTAMKAGYTT